MILKRFVGRLFYKVRFVCVGMAMKFIMGIVFLFVGVLFLFGNRKMGEVAFKFYRMIYTRRNLVIMFKVAGVILVVGGIVLVVV